MNITFDGDEARDHRIEAYTGAASLEGIARAATLAAHYAATGKVRFRAPYSSAIEFYIGAPANGSLTFPLQALSKISGPAGQRKAKLACALFLAILARSSGQAPSQDLVIEDAQINSGDVDALAEAATPGLERAHRWIDSNNKQITVGSSSNLVSLNEETKTYMQTEELAARSSKDVTVAAVNANSKTDRVYFSDLRRTVPFKVAKEATGRTLANLSRYLVRYVTKSNEWVNIIFEAYYYPDGRLKRILIFDCVLASDLEE